MIKFLNRFSIDPKSVGHLVISGLSGRAGGDKRRVVVEALQMIGRSDLMSSFTAILLCSLIAFSAASASAVQLKGAIRDWTVLGPLPNPERKAESRDRGAFDLDYLKPIGGETRAKITAESVITVTDADGKSIEVKAVPVSVAGESLDFCKHYIDTDHRLAYAYSEIVLPSDQEALFFLGSDDGAKVIVNGRTAFETLPPGGRAFTPRADRFKVKLHGGTNTVLVKVENGTGGVAVRP